ncbi:F-box domain protein [Aspergillus mulundensis]|uniref:Uncharacterized protein n=1 Tax=Aspergillus mulundensis TaxID=1810919 RepID=A0A3D8S516_9EURO|nr:hypothetical protein DSM5745_04925 [Aspergillus mulundensis]RDW81368.1 hypothetical protein DSM5745_04925 [Aspergillus mulundensis]
MTENSRCIEDLADELIIKILFFLVPEESRSSTSSPVNSHVHSPELNGRPAHVQGEKSDLDRFRLVCKRFYRIGTPSKFTSFQLRFSRQGFQRLEELVHRQLACWSQISDDHFPAAQTHIARLQDQIHILEGNHDREVLKKALFAFSSLRQVKLIRLQDQADEQLLDLIRDRILEETMALHWEPACARAVSNMGIALLSSNCTSVRFLGPHTDPRAAVKLLQTPSATLSAIGARLACLEVTFLSKTDLTRHMEDLSLVFHDVLLAAKKLESIHIGFSPAVPLGLRLNQVFHRIQWKKLRKLSLEGWHLTSDEIIALIRRHRQQVRNIRLERVFLRDGSHWRDVLSVLHDEMDEIESIYLRDIDYVKGDATHDFDGTNGHGNNHGMGYGNGSGNGTGSSGFQQQLPHSTVLSINHSELAFVLSGFPRHDSIPEAISKLSVDELGDNGARVTHEKMQLWQAWVLSSPRKIARRRI